MCSRPVLHAGHKFLLGDALDGVKHILPCPPLLLLLLAGLHTLRRLCLTFCHCSPLSSLSLVPLPITIKSLLTAPPSLFIPLASLSLQLLWELLPPSSPLPPPLQQRASVYWLTVCAILRLPVLIFFHSNLNVKNV